MLAAAGLGLIVSASAYRTDVEESQIRSILERRPDALVLTGLTHTAAARDLAAQLRHPGGRDLGERATSRSTWPSAIPTAMPRTR